jgi:hypothetical protein
MGSNEFHVSNKEHRRILRKLKGNVEIPIIGTNLVTLESFPEILPLQVYTLLRSAS